jgi:poly(A) polymerase
VSAALDAARDALRDDSAWLVGGAVRDRLLGRPLDDIDLVVDGDVRAAARHLALTVGGPAFPLSEEFGAWRVIGPRRAWQVDLSPMHGGTIVADLARRDFTVNAIAEPLQGGPLVDPHDGAGDASRRRLRMVTRGAFADDPLRVLRLARLACELDLEPEAETVSAARTHAAAITDVAQERVFAELRRIVASPRAVSGLELVELLELTRHVLPEFEALRGVEQNVYHDRDVHGHTLGVLQATIDLEADPGAVLGEEHSAVLRAFLDEPFADEMTRATALRMGAILHDIAKPATRRVGEDGAVLGFPGHDEQGALDARAILTRLKASERLRAHVAGLARHHLRLGYLVHSRPLSRRDVHAYLVATEPVSLDVTLLSVADRLATRGRKAEEAIAAHVGLAREILPDVIAWETTPRPGPLLRGDELAERVGIVPGPLLGELLAEVDAARFAGEVDDIESVVDHARAWLAERDG